MGRHRFDENKEDGKWGGPALSEQKEAEAKQRHSRDEEESEVDRREAEQKP